MNRVVEPEILETLADDHPDAVQSRAESRLDAAHAETRKKMRRANL